MNRENKKKKINSMTQKIGKMKCSKGLKLHFLLEMLRKKN